MGSGVALSLDGKTKPAHVLMNSPVPESTTSGLSSPNPASDPRAGWSSTASGNAGRAPVLAAQPIRPNPPPQEQEAIWVTAIADIRQGRSRAESFLKTDRNGLLRGFQGIIRFLSSCLKLMYNRGAHVRPPWKLTTVGTLSRDEDSIR